MAGEVLVFGFALTYASGSRHSARNDVAVDDMAAVEELKWSTPEQYGASRWRNRRRASRAHDGTVRLDGS